MWWVDASFIDRHFFHCIVFVMQREGGALPFTLVSDLPRSPRIPVTLQHWRLRLFVVGDVRRRARQERGIFHCICEASLLAGGVT